MTMVLTNTYTQNVRNGRMVNCDMRNKANDREEVVCTMERRRLAIPRAKSKKSEESTD